MKFIRNYFKRLINECLLDMKITSLKVTHPQPDKVEIKIENCSLISGGCCIETTSGNKDEMARRL